jgi:hypothetical protein
MTTTGWHAPGGPLDTLNKVGLWPNPRDTPNWVRSPRVERGGTGREIYTAGAGFLSDTAVRSLAALSLEGWSVRVTGGSRGLEFKIYRPLTVTP